MLEVLSHLSIKIKRVRKLGILVRVRVTKINDNLKLGLLSDTRE